MTTGSWSTRPTSKREWRRSSGPRLEDDVDLATIFGRFVGQMVIGLTRYGRGELLSADSMIKKWAMENLLTLLGGAVAPETNALLDNLDPRRRFEAAFPTLARHLETASRGTAADAAALMVDIAEERLLDIPGHAIEVRAMLRDLIARVRS